MKAPARRSAGILQRSIKSGGSHLTPRTEVALKFHSWMPLFCGNGGEAITAGHTAGSTEAPSASVASEVWRAKRLQEQRTHLVVRGNVPDGDRVVLHVFVDGQIRRLVNLGRF